MEGRAALEGLEMSVVQLQQSEWGARAVHLLDLDAHRRPAKVGRRTATAWAPLILLILALPLLAFGIWVVAALMGLTA